MVTFSKLEKKGNLGNQLFQIASTIGIAHRNGLDYAFPRWSFQEFFSNPLPILDAAPGSKFHEPNYHYEPITLETADVDLEGWFQSERYFDVPLAKFYFKFDEAVISKVKNRFSEALSKTTILISIRRGDFVDHPDYFQLPVSYYINALVNFYPQWRESNLIILSDDIDYCKFHFSFLPNAYFGKNLPGVEQLALSTLCDHFIISNSTFSWWCAWFGEKETSIIIRPLHNFSESKRKVDDDKDYFPMRWKVYDHQNIKINLGRAILKFARKDEVVERYMNEVFNFGKIAYGFDKSNDSASCTILIDSVILPPFALAESVALANEHNISTTCNLKGNFLMISRYYDLTLFSRQFDFGIFTKILGLRHKESEVHLFVCSPSANKSESDENLFINQNFAERTIYSYAGKIKGVFAYRHVLKVKKQELIRTTKRTVKMLLNIDKK